MTEIEILQNQTVQILNGIALLQKQEHEAKPLSLADVMNTATLALIHINALTVLLQSKKVYTKHEWHVSLKIAAESWKVTYEERLAAKFPAKAAQ